MCITLEDLKCLIEQSSFDEICLLCGTPHLSSTVRDKYNLIYTSKVRLSFHLTILKISAALKMKMSFCHERTSANDAFGSEC